MGFGNANRCQNITQLPDKIHTLMHLVFENCNIHIFYQLEVPFSGKLVNTFFVCGSRDNQC